MARNLKTDKAVPRRKQTERLLRESQSLFQRLAETNETLLREIQERHRVEAALRESETKYRIVADNTYDWEWWRDSGGNFIYVSPSCRKITGHEVEEFLQDPDLLLRIIHPDDRAPFMKHQDEVEEKSIVGEIEFRLLHKSGEIRWIAHACQPARDEQGRLLGRRGSNRDITQRKRAELRLKESEEKLRHLSSRLLAAQETERRRVSRELHDELGSALAVLKLRISLIGKKLEKGQQETGEEFQQTLQYLDQIIDNVSRLSRDLSPSILEDLGLTPALRRLIENFAKNYGVKVASELIDVGHLFSHEAQIMIYRVFQEALTNIGKHARARNVKVQVRQDADRVSFLLEDDGVGFDMKRVAAIEASEKGLGLATLDERVRMLGGYLDLKSEPGKGTHIGFSIPIPKKEKD